MITIIILIFISIGTLAAIETIERNYLRRSYGVPSNGGKLITTTEILIKCLNSNNTNTNFQKEETGIIFKMKSH